MAEHVSSHIFSEIRHGDNEDSEEKVTEGFQLKNVKEM